MSVERLLSNVKLKVAQIRRSTEYNWWMVKTTQFYLFFNPSTQFTIRWDIVLYVERGHRSVPRNTWCSFNSTVIISLAIADHRHHRWKIQRITKWKSNIRTTISLNFIWKDVRRKSQVSCRRVYFSSLTPLIWTRTASSELGTTLEFQISWWKPCSTWAWKTDGVCAEGTVMITKRAFCRPSCRFTVKVLLLADMLTGLRPTLFCALYPLVRSSNHFVDRCPSSCYNSNYMIKLKIVTIPSAERSPS